MRARMRDFSAAAVMLATLSLGGVAVGNDELSESALRERLATLEAQIEEETAALEQAETDREAELERAREDRRDLAEELLEREANRQRLDEREQELEQEAAALRADVEQLQSAAAEATAGARSVAEQAEIALAEQPGTEDLRQQIEQARRELEDEDGVAAAMARLAEALDAVHEQALTLRVREATIYNAEGEQESVALLTAGHVAFAYQSQDEQRVAVALQSPADASGYRWNEDLPANVAAALREAFDQATAGEGVTLPMDVTRQLRVEAVQQEQGPEEFLQSGGLVMLPLGAVALAALLLVLERAWMLYGRNRSDRRRVAKVLRAARDHRFDDAEQVVSRGGSVVARTMAACLRRRTVNTHAMEDSIQEQLLHELPRLQRFLGGIAILAAVAPLLGLLGTVTGIIQTFGVIRAFGNANPSLMAGGISEALVTTATGLTIAIPILLLHALLRGRVDRIVADAEKHAATLLNILSHDSRSDEAAPAGSASEAANGHQPNRAEEHVG